MTIKNRFTQNKSSRDGHTPDMIVCHQTAGTSLSSALYWFLDPTSQISSNYLVDLNGDIVCCVPITEAAWCNGNRIKESEKNLSNHYTKSLNSIVRSRAVNANKYTISIEFVHKGNGNITGEQRQKGVELMKHIIQEVETKYKHKFIKDRNHIIGHYEISPVNKAGCPGKDFPFDYFVRELNPLPDPPKPPLVYEDIKSQIEVRLESSKVKVEHPKMSDEEVRQKKSKTFLPTIKKIKTKLSGKEQIK